MRDQAGQDASIKTTTSSQSARRRGVEFVSSDCVYLIGGTTFDQRFRAIERLCRGSIGEASLYKKVGMPSGDDVDVPDRES